jgi:glucose-6-phosphate 1-dehydrogenase
MTFRSLYRLEARELSDCPNVDVAFDDWTLEQRARRVRDSIAAFGSLATLEQLVGTLGFAQDAVSRAAHEVAAR